MLGLGMDGHTLEHYPPKNLQAFPAVNMVQYDADDTDVVLYGFSYFLLVTIETELKI
jgi:hypothetical protein